MLTGWGRPREGFGASRTLPGTSGASSALPRPEGSGTGAIRAGMRPFKTILSANGAGA